MRFGRPPQVRFRLYTEAVNVDATLALVSQYFKAFTVTRSVGYWEGQQEESITIEIISTPHSRELVETVAERIRTLNAQEAVLVTVESVEANLHSA